MSEAAAVKIGDGCSAVGVAALQPRLDKRASELDVAYRASMDEALGHLRRTGAADRGKRAGDRAPDFMLADRGGRPVTLSGLLRQGPVVLSFFRGEWCSFCRLEMDALIEATPDIAARGGRLVMVSPQGPTEALLRQAHDIPGLTVLRDPMNGVGLQYGLVFRMPDILRRALLAVGVDLTHHYGSDSWLLPIPATYVIGADGMIALAHVEPDFTKRLEPDVILEALQALGPERG
jgi:peroxiredoxin